MASLGVHPSSSVEHKFWESLNANGSDSVTRNYPEVCQQGHRSVTGCNKATPTPDTSTPMDIDQRKCKQEPCTCYNCEEKGHLSHHCPKPRKQWICSAEPNEIDIKGLLVEAVAAVMDARDAVKKM